MAFDLHAHSNCSDGTLTPEQVVELALKKRLEGIQLDGIALTDHDTTSGVCEARKAAGDALEVLVGCELSAEHDKGPVHVLAIGFDECEPRFKAARTRIFDGREGRAAQMVALLRQLGVEITYEEVRRRAAGAIGRPHIAAAMVEAGVVPDVASAFTDEWIGTGGRAYIPKPAVTPVEAVRLITGAGGVAVAAHPSIWDGRNPVPEPVLRQMADAGLAALEVDHPDQSAEARDHWRALARQLGIEVTGGSDCHGALHGNRLGQCTTPREVVDRLLAGRSTAAAE